MTSREPRMPARLQALSGPIARATRGARTAGLGKAGRACAYLAFGLAVALSGGALAQDAAQPDKSGDEPQAASPHGGGYRAMVRYPKPVMHNGKLVLWHGVWRSGGRSGFGHPRPGEDRTQAPADANVASAPHALSILADSSDPTATKLAGELAGVMNGDDASVKVVIGAASRGAMAKAIAGDSFDFALAPLDALVDAPSGADWRSKAPYVARLQNEEIELVVPRSIGNISQLAGRKVNVSAADSVTAATAALIFSRINVAATWTNYPLGDALQRLKDGKIDAVFMVGGRDSELLANFGDDGRFHLATIPYAPLLRDYYAPARATAKDWPKLIGADEKVDTLSAPIALVAIDGANPARVDRLSPAASRFLANFDQLLDDSKDAAWRDVNLAARIDQLPRFGAAQAWLDQNKGETNADVDAFRTMAQAASAANGGPSSDDSDKLYQSLMRLGGAAQ
jgi:TRAP-type uncharacterized transport system substrate-binding protein